MTQFCYYIYLPNWCRDCSWGRLNRPQWQPRIAAGNATEAGCICVGGRTFAAAQDAAWARSRRTACGVAWPTWSRACVASRTCRRPLGPRVLASLGRRSARTTPCSAVCSLRSPPEARRCWRSRRSMASGLPRFCRLLLGFCLCRLDAVLATIPLPNNRFN